MIWTNFKKEEHYIILSVQEVDQMLNNLIEEKVYKTSKHS